MRLVLNAACLIGEGGAAVPGFHAQEWASRGPESHHGELAEVQGDAPAGPLMAEGDVLGFEILKDDGIQAAEGVIVQGDFASVHHGLPLAGLNQALSVQQQGVRVLGLVEDQLVVLEALPLRQGAVDGGVGPHAEGHGRLAGVLHQESGGKAVFQKPVPDPEDEGEGVARKGVRVFPELQGDAIGGLLRQGEGAFAGKAVAGHLAVLAIDIHFAVLQRAHHREEVGVSAGPESGIALPDVLGSGLGFQGDQLAALRVGGGGEGGASERDAHEKYLLSRGKATYPVLMRNDI